MRHGAEMTAVVEKTQRKGGEAMEVLFGILIPFIETTLGSACEFFMKKSLGDLVSREFKSGQFGEGSNIFVNNL